MSALTEQDVQRFKDIVKEKTGKHLTDDEARTQTRKYIGFIKMILRAADQEDKEQAGSN